MFGAGDVGAACAQALASGERVRRILLIDGNVNAAAGKAFRPNREIAEAGWFPIDGLPDGTGPATIRRIGEIFRGDKISTNW